MLKIIVNADDFGMNKVVNEEIMKSYLDGILTSASIMANGDCFDHAIDLAMNNQELDVGIHLTMTKEKPVLSSKYVKSIVDSEGKLLSTSNIFARRYFSGKISLLEVESELTAQIEKVINTGIKISHIDSHQHLHILPDIAEITVRLAQKYSIKFIRLPRENIKSYMFKYPESALRILQMCSLNFLCSKIQKQILYKADYFVGFFFGGVLNKQNLKTLISNLPSHGICELMCHPGLHENFVSKKNYRLVEESLALRDPEIVQILKNRNIQRTSFNKIFPWLKENLLS